MAPALKKLENVFPISPHLFLQTSLYSNLDIFSKSVNVMSLPVPRRKSSCEQTCMMEVSFQTFTKTVTVVKWKVGIPRTGYHQDTALFVVRNCGWKLRLSSKVEIHGSCRDKTTEYWSMKLYIKDEQKLPRPFPLTAYIRHKGEDIFLSQREIDLRTTEIFRFSQERFRELFSDIRVVGTTLLFILDFHVETVDHGISPGAHKAVQTSDSMDCADIHPCLENLSHEMRRLLADSSPDSDVQLKCGDVSIGAHKLILAARSPVFRNMMQSDMLEGREGCVDIVDMSPDILQLFVRYVYSGTLPKLTEDTALPLYEAADKYQVEELGKRCSRFLSRNLSRENALRVLVIADAHNDKDLKGRVVPYVLDQGIPNGGDEWLKFCEEYPRLATELLNRLLFC